MTNRIARILNIAVALLQALVGVQSFVALPPISQSGRFGGFLLQETAKETQPDSTEDGIANGARIYLDMEVAGEAIGRLEFEIPNVNLLPLHTDNIMKLCTQAMASVDPRVKYIGCEFQHSPQFVEGFAQYRWGHTLNGRGRNAVGRAEERITDPENMRNCLHSVYGGQYYGLNYDNEVPKQIVDGEDRTVVLTVPLVGPGRGSTGLAIVRVGESPPEWRERLLLNSAVLGWLDPESTETLHAMARQTKGPPKVVGSGVL
ncbi:expressed unknown protein [Seminavis robusta]|uniref:Uncharacterized protein n=1 Tax=Seminavis robusta TaxID=568900 RepID=A0A9N8HJ38_9STRA|nr:expressed unknown protein [Seminavis robusta]|eukprot:Sro666_g184000.1 n/a (260) ;mRNA; r:27984-28763